MKWIRNILNFTKRGPRNTAAAGRDDAPSHPFENLIPSVDNPIDRAEDDSLGREAAARDFAQSVLSLDPADGVVVGVLGAWGSGKTSFINLARNEFTRRSVPILDFNPWMFSGTQQLVEAFFKELAAQLRLKPELASIAQDLEDYGNVFSGLAWLPVVGPWVERGRQVAATLGKVLKAKKEGLTAHRRRLERALTALHQPIIVVLDDIDRLSSAEIRDIFKLVRLTASFPNVVYIVAFDRLRVEQALSEQGVPGRDYLEKILQVAFDLPPIAPELLGRQILNSIEGSLAGIDNPGPFDDQLWPDAFAEIVRPLIRNLRDVRRYAVAIRSTVTALAGQIGLTDILALEAIRTFLPDVFGKMHLAAESLTTTSDSARYDNIRAKLKSSIDSLLAAAGDQQNVVRSMITRLFPAARWHIENYHFGNEFLKTWLRERRVAHQDILRLYLERAPNEHLQSFSDAERAFALMTNRAAFDDYLRSLEPQRLQDVIASLETFEEQFSSDHVVPGTIVLLNLRPDLPERTRGMFDPNTDLVVGRVTYRLLRSLPDQQSVEAAVSEILPALTSLGAKLGAIDTVGHREGVGHRLVSEVVSVELLRRWRAEVRSAPPEELQREHELLFVLMRARRDAASDEGPLLVPESPEITLRLLRGAKTEALGNSVGSRAVRRLPRLEWSALVEVLEGEDAIRKRVERLRESALPVEKDLSDLLDKYLGGWRPNRFGE